MVIKWENIQALASMAGIGMAVILVIESLFVERKFGLIYAGLAMILCRLASGVTLRAIEGTKHGTEENQKH